MALEKVERSSGSLVGSSIASIQKSAAPEVWTELLENIPVKFLLGDNNHCSYPDVARTHG